MSLEAITAARKVTGIKPRAKFVLMALADYADDNQEAWPRQATLAEWTCMSRKTVNEALQELEHDYGLISSVQQYRDDGGKRAKKYKLNLRVAAAQPWNDPHVTNGDNPCNESLQGDVTDRYSKNPHKEPPQELKPSSTSVDARAEKKEASASGAMLGFEYTDEPLADDLTEEARKASASPKGSPPSSAAPPLNEVRELAEVWNQHRGKLREFRALGKKRTANLKRLIRECKEAGADPKLVVRLAAQELSQDSHYLNGGYDLENAIQSGRIAKFIDDALAPQPGEGLVAGQVYSWPRDPSRPWAGELLGTFTGEIIEVRGRTFAVMDSDGAQVRAPVDSLEPKE